MPRTMLALLLSGLTTVTVAAPSLTFPFGQFIRQPCWLSHPLSAVHIPGPNDTTSVVCVSRRAPAQRRNDAADRP